MKNNELPCFGKPVADDISIRGSAKIQRAGEDEEDEEEDEDEEKKEKEGEEEEEE